MSEFVTVLFKVEDKEIFKNKFTEWCGSMCYDVVADGAKVVAIDRGNLFAELEKLEEEMLEVCQ